MSAGGGGAFGEAFGWLPAGLFEEGEAVAGAIRSADAEIRELEEALAMANTRVRALMRRAKRGKAAFPELTSEETSARLWAEAEEAYAEAAGIEERLKAAVARRGELASRATRGFVRVSTSALGLGRVSTKDQDL